MKLCPAVLLALSILACGAPEETSGPVVLPPGPGTGPTVPGDPVDGPFDPVDEPDDPEVKPPPPPPTKPACAQFFECGNPCQDNACVEACIQRSTPEAVEQVRDMLTCVQQADCEDDECRLGACWDHVLHCYGGPDTSDSRGPEATQALGGRALTYEVDNSGGQGSFWREHRLVLCSSGQFAHREHRAGGITTSEFNTGYDETIEQMGQWSVYGFQGGLILDLQPQDGMRRIFSLGLEQGGVQLDGDSWNVEAANECG